MDWKAKPADKVWLNNSLEIQIILNCNWRCASCDSYSQFPSLSFTRKGTMTLPQIEHFVGEMQAGNAYFGRIRILGGEPSLHPQLPQIVQLLHDELVLKGHVGQLEIISNGSHAEKLQPVKHLLKIRVSDENDKQKHHTASMVHTPQSLGYKGNRCRAPEHCGWSLSYWGFAPCSSGGGIMRLRDLLPEQQRVSLPIIHGTEANWPELQSLCDLCYHGLRPEHKIRCGTGTLPGQQELSAPNAEVWSHLAPWLQGKQPDWQVYGQEEKVEA